MMKTLKEQKSYKEISRQVDEFVKEKLEGYTAEGIGAKVIHDPVWGSTKYDAWEMQIIDSPLIQRLRNISQVGLAVLTYPAARHSRFEHSLGVAAGTKLFVKRLNENSKGFKIEDDIRNKLVLAAIMHDVGHCFYSHLSESTYEDLKDFAQLHAEVKENLGGVKPKSHEILSLLIVNCNSFRKFFKEKVHYPDKTHLDELLEDVGKIIIGATITKDGVIESYQTEIINGPFDVDKLDYIRRDSHTAGLALDFDIERLFTKITIYRAPGESPENRLVIQANGVTAIEELTFCRMMLFSYIYYHQKVLITDAIIRDYVQALKKLGLLKTITDFLRLDESSLLELSKEQKGKKPFPEYGYIDLERLVYNIRNRTLPKRCIEVSQNIGRSTESDTDEKNKKLEVLLNEIRENDDYSLEKFNKDIHRMFSYYTRSNKRYLATHMSKLMKINSFEKILEKRKEIYEKLVEIYKEHGKTVDFDTFDIYLVIPPAVSHGAPGERSVLSRDNKLMAISDFIKLEVWASSFNAYKWRGYVYVAEKIDRRYAAEACSNVLFDGEVEPEELTALLKS